MTTVRPTWQVDTCPTWCVVLHAEDDHPHDRVHMSDSMSVRVRQLLGATGTAGATVSPFAERDAPAPATSPERADATATADLAVTVHRRDGAGTTWLYAGDGAVQSLELTADSWAHLLPAVDRALTLARA